MAATRKKTRPTLSSIEEQLGGIQQWQRDHEAEDRRVADHFRRQLLLMPSKDDLSVVTVDMATKSDLTLLATKKDIAGVLEIFGNLSSASRIIRGGAHWTWRVLLFLTMLVAIFSVLTGGARAAVVWMMHETGGI